MSEVAAKILSKFKAPRGVLKRTAKASEIALEGGKKLSADTPEGAEQLLETVYGSKKPDMPSVDKEALAERFRRQKAEKMLNAEGETVSSTVPDDGAEFAGPKDKSMSGKAMRALSYPQRKLFAFAADKLGVKADEESSENTASNLVEAAASKLGVPEDSVVGNAAKAGTVALAEVFADPTNLVPVGKLAKVAGKVGDIAGAAKLANKVVDLDKITKLARKAKLENFLEAVTKRGKSAAEMLRDKGAQEVKGAKIFKARS